MKKKLLIIFFLFLGTEKLFSETNNSIIITVGNQPITRLDLIKEIKFISVLSNTKVDEINKVSMNSHLRYFTLNKKTGKKEFRLGGFLTNRDQPDKYVILSNGSISWSVQTENSIFFKIRLKLSDQKKKKTFSNLVK